MFSLLSKDLRQHALPILYYALISAAFPLILILIATGAGTTTGSQHAKLLLNSFVVVLFSPIIIGQWLIYTEKTKRTLFLLRVLPVSSHRVVIAKELAALCMLVAFATSCVTSTVFLLYGMVGLNETLPDADKVYWVGIGVVIFTQLMLFTYLRFDHRLATQIPFGGLLLLLLVFIGLKNYKPALLNHFITLTTKWYAIAIGYLIGFGLIGIIHFSIVWLFEKTDWSRPTEE